MRFSSQASQIIFGRRMETFVIVAQLRKVLNIETMPDK
jgi:hypothetical protein